ncbi:MAG: DUF721 domain-containing protein [Candidatus Doudnabacteria bacterium]|nr:DUF721 domain-containing protein [bacterium]MDZ4243737.1 DUF721 domain-containing protein [Candidatus Doudnabacteria bacterium]
MFEKLSNFLSAQFGRKDLQKQLEIVRVFDVYLSQIKNLPQAEGARPLSLRNKILTIAVPSAVAAGDLRLRESQMIEQINSTLGEEVVRRIVYRF